MRYHVRVVACLLAASLFAAGASRATGQGLPLKNGRPIVASVGPETISLDELVMQLDPGADRARLRQGRATAEELALLERLVNVKLIVREAGRMGLDQAPEIQKQVEVTSRQILRDVLMERLTRDVKADPAAVERLYREAVREWKTSSLLFQDEKAAAQAQKELAGGAGFAQVAAKAVAAKTAKTDADNAYHARKEFLPQIAEAVAKLQVGQVSPVLRLQSGSVVVKVTDIRYPEKPEARAAARQQALNEKRQAVIAAHEEQLKRQSLVVNKAVLDAIDYEAAKPGVDALLKDKRVVAEVKGGQPVTVGDLTDYLRLQFFHGTEEAAERKQMNAKKRMALDATLSRRLLNQEAQRLGIEKTNAYRDRLSGYRDSLVFDAFVQKVIAPENRMQEAEVKRYYDAHLKDYSSPEMMKIRSLAFTRRDAAESAVKKLRDGADYSWVVANVDGQADKSAPNLLSFDGRPVMTGSMPEGARKALAGAKAGERRLYASPDGIFYVLSVQQVVAPAASPFAEVKEQVAKAAYGEKLKKAVEDYGLKLRAHSRVQTYLKRVR